MSTLQATPKTANSITLPSLDELSERYRRLQAEYCPTCNLCLTQGYRVEDVLRIVTKMRDDLPKKKKGSSVLVRRVLDRIVDRLRILYPFPQESQESQPLEFQVSMRRKLKPKSRKPKTQNQGQSKEASDPLDRVTEAMKRATLLQGLNETIKDAKKRETNEDGRVAHW
ncbi:hypothetical protein MMC20_001369 [Loxospora ochrophaea]|nr:hypothetical protein [Loxospora ochrophaea]